jgi:hypothetical protein
MNRHIINRGLINYNLRKYTGGMNIMKRLYIAFVFVFLIFSCSKEINNNTGNSPGLPGDIDEEKQEEMMVEGPSLNENNAGIREPVEEVFPINPNKDAIEKNQEEMIVEGPYLNENNVGVREPVEGVFPINPAKDAIENKIDLDDIQTNIEIYYWNLGIESCVIDFKSNNTYLLGHPMGDEYFCNGTYKITENNIIVNYPDNIEPWYADYQKTVLDFLFSGDNQAVLTYDRDYSDFDVLTCLRFGDKIFRNYAIKSPYGQEVELKGVKVIKYNEYEDAVIITENLRMRKHPDIHADTITLTSEVFFPDENIYQKRYLTSNLVYTNSIHTFDAKTVEMDTIDGITAPWYRIWVVLNDIYIVAVWVFGGYVKELPAGEYRDKAGEYYRKYWQSLIDNKVPTTERCEMPPE